MALLLKHLFRGYHWLFTECSDPRSDDYYLMSSPLQPLAITLLYLYWVYDLGPRFMKNRPPFALDTVMIVFNLAQVLANALIVYQAILELMDLDWSCSPMDYSRTPRGYFILNMAYLFFMTKIADLLDTVFFVLRKKTHQISFLHVYHHSGMVFLGWTGVRFLGGGHSVFLGGINSFVHTVMYSYYFLTAWKPEYKRNIWWKKHITQLQLAQFFLLIVIYGRLLFLPDCAYPKVVSYIFVPQNVFMLLLFGDFYYKAYVRPHRAKSSHPH